MAQITSNTIGAKYYLSFNNLGIYYRNSNLNLSSLNLDPKQLIKNLSVLTISSNPSKSQTDKR